MIDLGWTTTIIAASTEHPSGRQRLSSSEPFWIEHIDGVEFLWLNSREYAGNGTHRLLNIADYTRRALFSTAFYQIRKPDAVVGSTVHPLAAWAASVHAKRRNVPFIYEVRDLWPQTLIDMGRISSRGPAAIVLRALERKLARQAAVILSVLPNAGEYFEGIGLRRETVQWLPQGVDLDQFPVFDRQIGPFTLMYFGAHGTANNLNTVLDAVEIVNREHPTKPILVRFIGNGPLKPELQRQAKSLGLSNLTFEPPVPASDIPRVAAEADCFVVCFRDLPNLYRFGISPRKLYDYMAAGRPTILATSSEDNLVAQSGGGITVAPGDPIALAEAIIQMVDMGDEKRRVVGALARREIKSRYDFSRLAAQLAESLDQVITASPKADRT